MQKRLFLLIPVLLLFLSACSPGVRRTRPYTDPDEYEYSINVDTDVIDQIAIDEAVETIENNLKYAEEENIDAYLGTIISSSHADTRVELESFFEDYDLEHTILMITVKDQEEDIMLIEVEQQTIVTDAAEEAENYRDHVAIANHTLELEDNRWRISQTVMTETFFIE